MTSEVMTALVVDDEPIARQVLRESLESCPEIRVIGEADNGDAALRKISDLKPDLVFLDLQMPRVGGFEVVQRLEGPRIPLVVIVTAFDNHVLEALDAGAIDYLLKPVREERLKMAVNRVWRMRKNPVAAALEIRKIATAGLATGTTRMGTKVIGRNGTDYVFLDPAEILAFQADGELVWIVTARGRSTASHSLNALENQLAGSAFERVHRNTIVNLDHVRKLSPLSSQRWLLTLSNGLEIVVSRRMTSGVRKYLRR